MVDESNSTEPWVNPEQRSQDTSKSSHELPMESRAKVEPGSGKHRVHTSRRTEIVMFACGRKLTKASCRRRAGTVVPRAEHFGDLIAADHKVFSVKKVSHGTIIDMPWWYKTWQPSGYNPTEDPEEPNEVPGADEETKSHLH